MKDKKTIAIVLAVGCGTFMSALDSSVVNLAMPLIKNQFSVSLSMVEWIVTAYLLVVSSLLLTYGRLSDLYGQKKFYLTGFIIFVIGSALCGFSSGIGMLITFRVVQALGAGMLFSTGPAIITNAVPPENRGRALSAVAVAVALGLSSGPVIGGLLATYIGWPSIFFINVPIGLAGIVMVFRFVPDIAKKTEKVRFDVLGSVLVFAGLFLLLLPLSISGDYTSPALFYPLLIAGLLIIAAFIVYELKHKNPMLNVRLFQNRVFAASNAAALLIYVAQFVLIFLFQFYLQNLRGFAASFAGILYLPMPLASMCVAPLAGILSDKVDSRFISSSGALAMACGLFLLSFLKASTPIVTIIIAMAVTGLGFGLFNTPNNSAIMGNVPPANRGTASGTLATMRNIGMALGVAISGALFSLFNNSATAAYTAAGQTGNQLTANAFVYALRLTYLAAAAIAVLATVASLIKGKVMTEKEKNADRT